MSVLDGTRAAGMLRHRDRAPAGGPASLGWVVVAGGGTAGHLYPALAVVQALSAAHPGTRFRFLATSRAIDERVLAAAGQERVAQAVQPLSLRPWRMPRFVRGWRQGVIACDAWFAQHHPSLVIGTGGYASGPAVRVASRRGVPVVLLNPDCVPGRANRLLARWADKVFVQWPQTRGAFGRASGKVVVSGCPIRPEFEHARRDDGIRHYGLCPTKRTLLVTGASLGSRNLNAVFRLLAPRLARLSDWQVLHLTGTAEREAVSAAYEKAGCAATCVTYTEQMAEALAAADLVVGRAGASTLAELTAVGCPSILVPYPYHRDNHQRANAHVLVDRGAALICDDCRDASATAARLAGLLLPLLADDERRGRMRTAAVGMGHPRAAARIASACATCARDGQRRGSADAGVSGELSNGSNEGIAPRGTIEGDMGPRRA